IAMIVTVEVADLDDRGRLGESLEHRALPAAIAAPRPGQTEHGHLPRERPEELPLRGRQRRLLVRGFPASLVCWRAVLFEKLRIGKPRGPAIEEVHDAIV